MPESLTFEIPNLFPLSKPKILLINPKLFAVDAIKNPLVIYYNGVVLVTFQLPNVWVYNHKYFFPPKILLIKSQITCHKTDLVICYIIV